MPVITVSQLNRYIGSVMKGDRNLQGLMIKGEISNFTEHYSSGHLYFSLKDPTGGLKAVMFASAAARLKFRPEDGMEVIATGSVAVYERDGAYQLYVNDLCPSGAGSASVALEQLKKKLAKAGIFDTAHKRPLPAMPKKIGAVTSVNGAAVRDIINVLSRRYPIGELCVFNAAVQGESAPDSVCRGIIRAEEAGCDVIIVGRGGGSAEELGAFNTEKVAYGIYNCKVPVISAVGHETDITIADLAADLRAPTPSAAAELAVPSAQQIYERVDILEKRLENAALKITDRAAERLIRINSRISMQSPENRLRLSGERLDTAEKRLSSAFEKYITKQSMSLAEKSARLEAMSPLKVLSRGYSLVYSGTELISNAAELSVGDRVNIRFGKGQAEAEIISK